MKVNAGKTSKSKVIEYNSMSEFYKYLCDTPFNNSFRWAEHKSVTNSVSFTQTKNFDEAVDLMKNGWKDMSEKLVQRLKVEEQKMEPVMKPKTVYGVAGYQAVVPLYLNGVPTNMLSKKQVPVKQKVITLNKCINYSWTWETKDIVEESIKAFRIIKKLEANGYRCNLNVILGTSNPCNDDEAYIVKIRVKNSTEKLNLAKLAFPLVHPSMLRRLMLRWEEVFPSVSKGFVGNYGHPMEKEEMAKVFDLEKGEYILPARITKDVTKITGIEDLGDI